METTKVSTLGFDLNYDVPSSIEEFDQRAKQSGAALREANKNVIYRSVLAEFRDAFCEKVAAQTGIERRTRVVKPEVKNEQGEITQEEVLAWDEKEKQFFDRVCGELVAQGQYPSAEASAASFQSLAQEVISAIDFDPSASERTSGPKKTPKTYVGIAEELIKMAGSVEDAVARFNKKTGRAVEATADALAKGIWEDQLAQKKSIAAGYAG